MKRLILLLAATLFVGLLNNSASAATYYSQGSVTPSTLTNWNTNRLGGGSSPGSFTTAGDVFVIQGTGNGGTSPHNMTTSAPWTVGGAGAKLQVENGGTLTATSAVTISSGTATFQLDGGGNYVHNNTTAYGGSIFNGIESFAATSTVTLNNSNTTGPSGVSFGNLTVNFTTAPGGNVNCGGGLTTINGNLTITSTSTVQFVLTGTTDFTLNIAGNYSQTGGTLNPANGNNGTAIINLTGDFSLTGGSLAQSGGNSNTDGTIFFNKAGTQNFTSGGTVSGNVDFSVNSGSTLQMAVAGTTVTGRGFTLSSGATLGIRAIDGIASAGAAGHIRTTNRTFSTGANYIYNGSANQTTGDGLPATVNNLTAANTGGAGTNVVSMTQALTVTNTLIVTSGVFDQGASFNLATGTVGGTISIASGGTLRNTGSGSLTLGTGGVSNAGLVNYDGGGVGCGGTDAVITSAAPGTPWSVTGTGSFSMVDVAVSNQAGTAIIIVYGGANNGGNGLNWVFVGTCPAANSYTWIGGVNADWTVPTNWSPTRASAASAVTIDQLTFDFNVTPAPTVMNVPNQEIASLDLINGVAVKLNAQTLPAGTKTLTINGGAANDLTVPLSNSLTLQGATGLVISLSNNSTGLVGGVIVAEDGPHQLLAATGSTVSFIGLDNSNRARFTTDLDYDANTHPFGAGAGNGSTNSIIFGAFSVYTHNAGGSPFGAVGSGPNVDFQTGSEADILKADNFQAANRKYATLVIGSGSVPVMATDSGSSGNFQFTNLVINHPSPNSSSLQFNGSGTSTVTIQGNITSSDAGTGTIADVILTAGSGGIQINAGGAITFGNQAGSHGIFFGSDALVASGTTLTLNRLLQMGLSADGIVTADGTVTAGTGHVVGAVRKTAVPASYVFPVGLIDGYTPVEISSSTGGGDLTVRAVDAPTSHPSVDDPTSLDEYWRLTLNSGTLAGDLKFTYLQPDVDGTEANYKIIRIDGATIVHFPLTSLDTINNTATIAGISHFSDWTLGEPVAPSAVKLTRFNATRFADGVELSWETGFEVDNLGYHVYREQNGQRTLVTPGVIAGSALRVGPGSRLTAGYSYSWFDPQGTADAVYHLESIDLDGSREWVGPLHPSASAGERPSQRRRAKLISELVSAGSTDASLSTWPARMKARDAVGLKVSGESLTIQQSIAAGNAVKIQVNKSGWYRVTQADLVAAGFDPSTDARLLKLYVDGEEVPVSLSTAGARMNANDTLEFYGVAHDTPTTDTRTYWLVKGNSSGKRMIARRGKLKASDVDVDSVARSYNLTVERREKIVYFSNLLNGEAENIFGAPVFSSSAVNQTLPIGGLDSVSASQPELEVALQGLTDGNHQVQVKLNGVDIGVLTFTGRQHPVKTFAVDLSLLHDGNNIVSLQSGNGPSDLSLIDSVLLTYPQLYRATNNSLRFTAAGGQPVRIGNFATPNVRVIDVTDPNSPTQHSALSQAADGAYAATIQVPGTGIRTLIAFTDELSAHPASITANQPSTLNDAANGADMIIITHKDFRQAVEPLAALRRNQGLIVSVVDVEDVYDEFSYGAHTPDALKSFLMTAATDWQRKPQYLLLVGDSSWDPRNYLNRGYNDFVPTKLIDTQYQETGSDDWLADSGGLGLADMAIGRLPGRTSAEITLMVSKILSYEQERELNAPLRGALLVADNGFESRTADTGALMSPTIATQTINRSEVGNDDVTRGQIVDALNQGPMIVNFYGHGSVSVWTGAGLLDSDLAMGLTNANRPSLYVMMTCLNGYASDAYIDSLGEAALKAPNGGAMAVWASSGYTVPHPQFTLSSEFYRLLFSGQPVRLGEATRSAKAATTDLDVRRTWTLLGDPAMRIR